MEAFVSRAVQAVPRFATSALSHSCQILHDAARSLEGDMEVQIALGIAVLASACGQPVLG